VAARRRDDGALLTRLEQHRSDVEHGEFDLEPAASASSLSSSFETWASSVPPPTWLPTCADIVWAAGSMPSSGSTDIGRPSAQPSNIGDGWFSFFSVQTAYRTINGIFAVRYKSTSTDHYLCRRSAFELVGRHSQITETLSDIGDG